MPSWADDRDGFGRVSGWPNVEVEDDEKEITVRAALPGLNEKDVELAFVDGMLVIEGEKKHETTDERRIPVEDVEEEKAIASFESSVLTVTLPKKEGAGSKVRRIAINAH